MININFFLFTYLCVFILTILADFLIEYINCANLRHYKETIPENFIDVIDMEKLQKINAYTIDNTKLSIIKEVIGKLLFLVIILSGFLPWIAGFTERLPFILAGLLFFSVPGFIGFISELPFDYYNIFILEERYGFNTRTINTWISDLVKSFLLSIILGAILLSLLLLMMQYSGDIWWLWAWMIFVAFQLIMAWLYPTFIAPLFNKFTPIEDKELSEKIKKLAEQEGISIRGIFQMDAARRSRHTNAYFTGLGKTKRIVLYDTLIHSHDNDEIISILAHEIGHFKMGHIKKQLLLMGVISFVLLYLASRLIGQPILYESFGFSSMHYYVGVFLVSIIWEPLSFFISPAFMSLSRKYEKEADAYMYKVIKKSEPMVNALKRLAMDNLANLRPHPVYVMFHYSHPPIIERITLLDKLSGN